MGIVGGKVSLFLEGKTVYEILFSFHAWLEEELLTHKVAPKLRAAGEPVCVLERWTDVN